MSFSYFMLLPFTLHQQTQCLRCCSIPVEPTSLDGTAIATNLPCGCGCPCAGCHLAKPCARGTQGFLEKGGVFIYLNGNWFVSQHIFKHVQTIYICILYAMLGSLIHLKDDDYRWFVIFCSLIIVRLSLSLIICMFALGQISTTTMCFFISGSIYIYIHICSPFSTWLWRRTFTA